MAHHDQQAPSRLNPAFLIGAVINAAFVVVEVVYGISAQSSALLADAGHNATDMLSLLLAWGAAWAATKKSSGKFTYGLRKSTVLVSILNALLLFAAVAIIGREAYEKFLHPGEVEGRIVIIVASIGVVVNTATALLFLKGQKKDLNQKGAFLHMAADTAVSLGVVAAGIAIQLTGAMWIDPLISFGIILIIVFSSWGLLKESVALALDGTPAGIDFRAVETFLQNYKGVENVHHLHIWALSTTQAALTAHLVVPGTVPDDFIHDIRKELWERFEISHVTLQIEPALSEACLENIC